MSFRFEMRANLTGVCDSPALQGKRTWRKQTVGRQGLFLHDKLTLFVVQKKTHNALL